MGQVYWLLGGGTTASCYPSPVGSGWRLIMAQHCHGVQRVMTCPLPTIINYNISAIEIDTLVVVVVAVVLVLMCAVGSVLQLAPHNSCPSPHLSPTPQSNGKSTAYIM